MYNVISNIIIKFTINKYSNFLNCDNVFHRNSLLYSLNNWKKYFQLAL